MGDIGVVAPLFGKTEKEFGTLIGDTKESQIPKESVLSAEEQAYQYGKDIPKLEGMKYLFSSPEVVEKMYTGLATDIGGVFGLTTKEQSEKATRDFMVSLGAAKKSYEGLDVGESALKFGLESPLTYLVPVGAGFKVGGFVGKTVLKGAAEKAAIAGTEIGAETILGKTALSAAATARWGAKYGETLVGAGFLGAAGVDIATTSKTPYEAIGKTATLGISLPGAMIGYKGTEFVGKQMPTPKNFFRFIAGKAEPLTTFVEAKTPELVKTTMEPVVEKLTREPSGYELMTPLGKEIYKKLPTQEAKTILSESIKLASMAETLPRSSLIEMAKTTEKDFSFGTTSDIGERGFEVQKISKEHPKDIILGSLASSRFIKGFRAEKTELPTKNIHITEDMPSSIKEYMRKSVKPEIADIELASEFAAPYESLKIKGLDIHGIKRGAHKFGTPGEQITTTFMGESGISLVPGKVMEPIKFEGVSYENPVSQFYKKIEGGTKFMSRNIENLGGEKEMYREFVEAESKGKKVPGFSIRRGKDIPDTESTSQAFAEQIAKTFPKKGARALKSAEKIRKAEATKMYSGVPVSPEVIDVALEYGYEYGKGAAKSVIESPPKIPLVLKPTRIVETSRYEGISGKEKAGDYYPVTTPKEVVKFVGDYYPTSKPIKKVEPSGYYPTAKTTKPVEPGGYYPTVPTPETYPGVYVPTQVKFPRPWLDRYWNEELQSEIPRDEFFMNKDGEKETPEKRKKKQKGIQYTRRTRISPIFEGAEMIFEGTPVNPVGDVLKTPKKTKLNKKKKNKTKQFWET